MEDLEAALKYGQGRVSAHVVDGAGDTAETLRFSSDLHCAFCDIHYDDPSPNLFSFNSPVGACATCRGFGRTIGIDWNIVVPDDTKTLASGAVRPWQTESFAEVQDELMKFARRRGIPTDVPWGRLTAAQRTWVIDGEGEWDDGLWFGAKRFFKYLETKSYRMHIRVLLSRYRAYTPCPDCGGARLKPEALRWKIGEEKLSLHDVMLLPIDRCLALFGSISLPAPMDEATALLLSEIRTRLRYLVDVGLGYLTLDRQSRTLSGGEVQRINLTTALGTSLVNALFVLDEPSVGLHPRDIGRLIGVLHRLRDAGNTIVVVEHDPDVIRAADLVLDMGPGAGERGGRIVFFGGLSELLRSSRSLTAQYLTGKKKVEARVPGPRQRRRRGQSAAGRSRKSPLTPERGHPHPRGGRAQPQGHRRGHSPSPARLRHGSQRLGKIHADPGRAVQRPFRAEAQARGPAGEAPRHRGTRAGEGRRAGGPVPDRQNGAVEPGELRRGIRRDPQAFRRGAPFPGAGLHAGDLQLQLGKRQVPHVQRQRFRAHRDAVPERRVPALPRLRRPPVPQGGAGRAAVSRRRIALPGPPSPAKSVADVLDMTVTEACEFFSESPDILSGLAPLAAVGLGYVSLGQPVPTLSGGEAQRLKLAGFLGENATKYRGLESAAGRDGKGNLFLFDEPTTGLHFDDIATLLGAFRQLVDAGHSVVVIEHNLDVIRASDWIIDLGPEGGEAGGRDRLRGHALQTWRGARRAGPGSRCAPPGLRPSEKKVHTGSGRDGPGPINRCPGSPTTQSSSGTRGSTISRTSTCPFPGTPSA